MRDPAHLCSPRPQRLTHDAPSFHAYVRYGCAAGDWQALGHAYITNVVFSSPQWGPGESPLPASRRRVALGEGAGFLAAIRDGFSSMRVQGGTHDVPTLRTYRSDGTPLGLITWEGGRVVAMSWTVDDRLVVVDHTGIVRYVHIIHHTGIGCSGMV